MVDDDRTMLNALVDMVRELGHEPLPAATWSEAIRLYREHKPDVVLLDVMMPTIDGYKLAGVVKSSAETFVPVILITAFGDVASKRRGLASGADDFLTKPVAPWELEIRLASMLRVKRLTDELKQLSTRLQELAVTDELTGLRNRRSFNETLEREWARHRRYHHSLAVLVMDIDHFKAVNDTHGHAVGDAALKVMTASLRASTRETDTTARYGGEEFIVLAPETKGQDARLVGERIRQRVAADSEASEGVPKFTVSIGIATTESVTAATAEDLVRLADEALYEAKRTGRNRVVLAK